MTNQTLPALSVRDLTIALPPGADREFAVEHISFDVHPGEVVCLIGESGSGKSTIAHTIMGLAAAGLTVQEGRIRLGAEDLQQVTQARLCQLRGNRMSMVFQEPLSSFNPLQTIGYQIGQPLRVHKKLKRRVWAGHVLEAMADVGLPNPQVLFHRYPHELSGGQLQRAMIAAALVMEPDLLIADEPTTALDVTTQAQIIELFMTNQRRRQMALLFVTHDLSVVSHIADRILVMRQGQVVEQGTTAKVLYQPESEYTRELIAAVPDLTPLERPAVAERPAILEARNISKAYRSGSLFGKASSFLALNDASFQVREGEVLGVIGESGSGKSTLARCVAHLQSVDGGEVLLDGKNFADLSGKKLRQERHRIQMVFQDPFRSFNPRRKIVDSLIEGVMNSGVSRVEAIQRAKELMLLVGLNVDAIERYPHEFSGGQRQRLSIARALMPQPRLLIADEAVSALDVSVQSQVIALLDEIRQRLPVAMLFITHDLRVAARLCDRILVMQRGVIVEAGETAAVYRDPQHPYTRQLLQAALTMDVPSAESSEFAITAISGTG